ncbi:MAG: type II toxin-antitoxin system VapC family toxin [Candidatus Sungbacteria bacterium]|nr:type II toxin-antitoxin system VapC family toxin [Candidatus Sungbacteria bacterium]
MEEVRGDTLVDSDILIDYLRGRQNAREFLVSVGARYRLFISVVSIAETYAGRETRDPEKKDQLQAFLDNFHVIDFDRALAKKAGELRRDYGGPFADMIIAASALAHNLILATRNLKHYRGIGGLRVFAPYTR